MASSNASPQSTLYQIQGTEPSQYYGTSLGSLSDVNGDGIDDLLVGAGRYDSSSPQEPGEAFILSGFDGTELLKVEGLSTWDRFGGQVTDCSDIDGDGLDDFVVSARRSQPAGHVAAFSSATGQQLWIQVGTDTVRERFGAGLEVVGDVDRDGYRDLIAAYANFAANRFGVVLMSGVDGSEIWSRLNPSPTQGTFVNNSPSCALVNDLDSDGISDIAFGMGATTFGAGAGESRGHVQFLSAATGIVLMTLAGPTQDGIFGYRIAYIDDVDLDGSRDLLITSVYDSTNAIEAGAIRLYSGATFTPIRSHLGQEAEAWFGASAAALDDLDGDGIGDYAVSAIRGAGQTPDSGVVFVYSGATGSEISRVNGEADFDDFGSDLLGDVDLDADGTRDLVIGIASDNTPFFNSGGIRAVSGRDPVGLSICGPSVLNSTGSSAFIRAFGSTTAADQDFELRAGALPANTFGLFVVSRFLGPASFPNGSQGRLCLTGTIGRFAAPGQIQSSGDAQQFALEVDLLGIPQGGQFSTVQPGDTWVFQAWFRDGTTSSNFTDAVQVDFQ